MWIEPSLELWLKAYGKIFALAVLITWALTPIVKRFAIRVGVMDQPSNIKVHTKPTPRLGGVAIFIGFLVSQLVIGTLTPQQKGVIIGVTVAFIIGVIDDFRPVNAWIKLFALFIITGYLSTLGVMLEFTPWYPVNFFMTLFWVVGVTSAFNAVDNMDGLAAGLTFFAALAYAYVAYQNQQWAWGALAVALMGSCIGFLFFNFPPASIFMGDSGSFFLGYTLASLAIVGEWSSNPVKAMIVPVFILGLPIIDLIYVVVRRHHSRVTRTFKEIVTFSGKDHFSHRLVQLGLSQKQTVIFTYFVCLALSLGAVSIRYVLKVEAILLCIQYVIITLLIVFLMESVDRRSGKSLES